ncbi:toll/interleukin-1 receptor domain-containing protein [Acetobacter orleanensis]|uniref:TIR domain-containing protein n=1 Tax=Acetobacter orleanensis TaxID=104099 RepID=A0A4Y3TPV4_9PROT|nr:toll/interleukin-1 receptor domain-containing protein [Acetobacter orleanensis]KXV66538.1 hypothetical protein AD949_02270 [Acetobacter orleanensis]GAN67750.1 hypothetical protein Abol_011_006 [Acetobacter orleanensis JCM 7639]GBR23972.1 hypothetical protein AA0473_0519 [Acetobacter orleanensis NRIC 0473]GEB83087.1 hypothetical protein AOR01nite_15640 [Acetobacter orleanensis]
MNGIVFLSYSSKDEDFAKKLVNDIEKRGLKCWMSCRDILPGEDYQSAIVKAMDQSVAMLLLFSGNANRSKEIAKELALASLRNKPVIPARIEDILPTGAFEYQMTNAQFIDLFHNYGDALDRLCDALRRQAGLPIVEMGTSTNKRNTRILFLGGSAAVVIAAGIGASVVLHKPSSVPVASLSSNIPVAPDTLKATHLSLPQNQVLSTSVSEKSKSTFEPSTVKKEEVPSSPTETPAPISAPVPTKSVAAQPVQQDNTDLAPLVKQLASIDPNMRVSAIEKGLTDSDGKLSYAQVIQLLHGTREGSRAQIIRMLVQSVQAPIPVSVALSFLQSTDNFRENCIEELDQYLPESIGGDDVIALLGSLEQGNRFQAINKLNDHIQIQLTAEQALRVLRGTDGYWTQTLEKIASKLTKPQTPADLARLLGGTQQGNRFQGLKALSVAMPETMTVAEINKLLDGLDGFRSSGIEFIARRLERDVAPSDIASLLEGTEQGNRSSALKAVAYHMKKGLQGTEVVAVLEGMDGYWTNAVSTIRPNLEKPQSQASLLALIGNTSQGQRCEVLRDLQAFMPKKMSAADVQVLLQQTEGYYEQGLELLLPNIRPPSPEEVAQLVAPLSNSFQSGQMMKKLRELH